MSHWLLYVDNIALFIFLAAVIIALLMIELTPVGMRDLGEIERTVAAFARTPNGSMIVTVGSGGGVHRKLLISLAARHKLPAASPTDRRRPDQLWA